MEEIETGELNLLISGQGETINMIECDADETSEDLIREAFRLGVEELQKLHAQQHAFIAQCEVHPKEISYNKPSQALLSRVEAYLHGDRFLAMTGNTKVSFNELFYVYEKELIDMAKERPVDEKRKVTALGLTFLFPLVLLFSVFYLSSFESATAISPPKCALARNKIALTRTVSPLEISAIRASKNGVKSLP